MRNHPGIQQETDKCHKEIRHSRYSGIVAIFQEIDLVEHHWVL